MSLPRDLSLSPSYELLQQFVPELKTLRQSHVTVSGVGSDTAPAKAASMQLEVVATFEFAAGEHDRLQNDCAGPHSHTGSAVLQAPSQRGSE